MKLVLRKLVPDDEAQFLQAIARTAGSDPTFARYYDASLSFAAYLRILDDVERGIGLPEDHVPSNLLFGFVGGELVGRLMFRHELNTTLLRKGGQIGYVVVPEHRRRGYATEMLRQGLELARRRGLARVLVTCDEDNVASRKTIEKCGGIYEDSYVASEGAMPKRRYWIRL